jgi:hypothetical protein
VTESNHISHSSNGLKMNLLVNIFCRRAGIWLTQDVLRYSLSQDSVESVGLLSSGTSGGVVFEGKGEDVIYHLGGMYTEQYVFKFDIETTSSEVLASVLPTPLMDGAAAILSDDNRTAFIFNGRGGNILEFDMITETATVILGGEELPNFGTVNSTSAVRIREDLVWLFFAGMEGGLVNPVLEFNTTSKLVSIPENNSNKSFPGLYANPALVSDGRNGYIVGGFGRLEESDGSDFPTDGIVR